MLKTPDTLLTELAHFSGTENYYRVYPKLLLTDGAKHLADAAGAYWLFDIVFSMLPQVPRNERMFVVELVRKLPGSGATFRAHDGGRGDGPERDYYLQKIPYTDFPLEEYEFYVVRQDDVWVAMLKGEY